MYLRYKYLNAYKAVVKIQPSERNARIGRAAINNGRPHVAMDTLQWISSCDSEIYFPLFFSLSLSHSFPFHPAVVSCISKRLSGNEFYSYSYV